MFHSVAIDVCLSIVFIILLYSLLATVLQEIIAQWIKLRQRMLQKAICRMLDDSDCKLFSKLSANTFTKAFYDYPLVKYLAETNSRKPSYISSENFAQVVIHLLCGESNTNAANKMSIIHDNLNNNSFGNFEVGKETARYIRKLQADSNQDINRFSLKLQDWYNDTMERTTGWYKRKTQVILFCIGIVMAIVFNIDIIAITKILSRDDTARAQIVNMAISRQKDYARIIDSVKSKEATKTIRTKPDGSVDTQIVVWSYKPMESAFVDSTYKMLSSDAANVQNILGIGWQSKCTWDLFKLGKVNAKKDALCKTGTLTQKNIEELYAEYRECKTCRLGGFGYYEAGWKWLAVLGWLLTAIAISLGAPFWYDLLNKIMLLRGGGQKNATATTGSEGKKNAPPVKPLG